MDNIGYMIFLFGSYLHGGYYNDIDVLLVVDSAEMIYPAKRSVEEFNLRFPHNIIHTHIYTREEFANPENKFSKGNVAGPMLLDDLIELYNLPNKSINADGKKRCSVGV